MCSTVLLEGAGRQAVAARHRALRRRPWFITGHGRLPLPPLPDRQAARRLLGCPAGAVVLAQTGQVHPYKDPRPLLEAVADIRTGVSGKTPFLIVSENCPDPALPAAVTASAAGTRR